MNNVFATPNAHHHHQFSKHEKPHLVTPSLTRSAGGSKCKSLHQVLKGNKLPLDDIDDDDKNDAVSRRKLNLNDATPEPMKHHMKKFFLEEARPRPCTDVDVSFEIDSAVSSLAIDPRGNFLVAGFNNGYIRLYSLNRVTNKKGRVLGQIQARGMYTMLRLHVEISQDSRYVFAGIYRGSTETIVFDVSSILHDCDSPDDESQSIPSYSYFDAKLKGFGALGQLTQNPQTMVVDQTTGREGLVEVYYLLCGLGIKNLHVWRFFLHPTTHQPHWECILDKQTNGITIEYLDFKNGQVHSPITRSSHQNLRLWDISSIIQSPIVESDDNHNFIENDISHRDIPNSESTVRIVGDFAYGGKERLAIIDLKTGFRTEVEMSRSSSNTTGSSSSSSRRRRGQIRTIQTLAGCMDSFESPQVVVWSSDGTTWLHAHSRALGAHTPLEPLTHASLIDVGQSSLVKMLSSSTLAFSTEKLIQVRTFRKTSGSGSHSTCRVLTQKKKIKSPVSTPASPAGLLFHSSASSFETPRQQPTSIPKKNVDPQDNENSTTIEQQLSYPATSLCPPTPMSKIPNTTISTRVRTTTGPSSLDSSGPLNDHSLSPNDGRLPSTPTPRDDILSTLENNEPIPLTPSSKQLSTVTSRSKMMMMIVADDDRTKEPVRSDDPEPSSSVMSTRAEEETPEPVVVQNKRPAESTPLRSKKHRKSSNENSTPHPPPQEPKNIPSTTTHEPQEQTLVSSYHDMKTKYDKLIQHAIEQRRLKTVRETITSVEVVRSPPIHFHSESELVEACQVERKTLLCSFYRSQAQIWHRCRDELKEATSSSVPKLQQKYQRLIRDLLVVQNMEAKAVESRQAFQLSTWCPESRFHRGFECPLMVDFRYAVEFRQSFGRS